LVITAWIKKSGVVIYRMGGFCGRGKRCWRIIEVTFLGELMIGWDTINVAFCMSGFGLESVAAPSSSWETGGDQA
jgi:hypothetical protein